MNWISSQREGGGGGGTARRGWRRKRRRGVKNLKEAPGLKDAKRKMQSGKRDEAVRENETVVELKLISVWTH